MRLRSQANFVLVILVLFVVSSSLYLFYSSGPTRLGGPGSAGLFPSGSPGNCPSACCTYAAASMAMRTGVVFDASKRAWFDDFSAFAMGSDEISTSAYSNLETRAISEFISAGEKPALPCVLVHPSGHLCVLHDVFDVKGRRSALISHGYGQTKIVAVDDLDNDFIRVISASATCPSSACVKVGASIVEVSPAIRSLGSVKANSNQSYTVTIKNRGATSIVVDKPITSCGCTVVSLPEEESLEPGSQVQATISVNIGDEPFFSNRVLFKFHEQASNPIVSGSLNCELRGYVDKALSLSVERLDFGSLIAGKVAKRIVELSSADITNTRISEVKITPDWVRCDVRPSSIRNGLRSQLVEFTCTPPEDVSDGKFSGEAKIAITGDSRQVLTLDISGSIASNVRFVPDQISFGIVRQGEERTVLVEVLTPKSMEADVAVDDVPPGISIKPQSASNRRSIGVTLNESTLGPFSKQLFVTVSAGKSPQTYIIPCAGIITPSD